MAEIYQKWLDRFLERRQATLPDGRPLYAYLCTTQEYDSLEIILSSARILYKYYSFSMLYDNYPGVERLFVLYCAEWWRRNYTSGAWKWQPIFDAINWPDLDLNTRGRFVEQGLSYWKRKLIRQGVNREFLLTVACEGGLPVNLIRKDTGYLRAYLRAVLRDYGTYAVVGIDAVELAGVHLNYLPRSLRQPIVQGVAGILIQSIWELQSQVAEAANPVEQLDQTDPTWRQRLPLVLEDNAADDLINALLQQARKIRSGVVSRLRVVRRLEKIGDRWRFQAELRLPETIEKEALIQELQGSTSTGERLELQMCWGEKFVRVATLVQQGNQYNVYPLDPRRLHIRENVEMEISCFVYERGQQLGHLPLPGGNNLSDELPIIFVDRDGGAQSLEYWGQGSISSRFPEVYVLTSKRLEKIESSDDESQSELVEETIEINNCTASLYRIRGQFSIALDESASCIIRTRQQEESTADYRFEGKRLYFVEARVPIFKGMPGVKKLFENGKIQNVPAGEFLWSKASGKRNWQNVTAISPRGLVELRHIQNNECLLSRRVIILPEKSEIKLIPDQKSHQGTIELRNIQTQIVSWHTPEECQIEKHLDATGAVLHCNTAKAVSGRINIQLAWIDGCRCELAVPLPIEGGHFVAPDDRVVTHYESIGLENLPGYAAMAVSLHSKRDFSIHGKLKANDLDTEMHKALDFNVPLPEVSNEFGVAKLPLYQIYERLKHLFNYSSDKDAMITLELLRGGHSEVRINIKQFSIELIYDADSQSLSLEPEGTNLASEFEKEPVELLPMFDPEEESRFLMPQQSDKPSWSVKPEILEKGPWLAVAPERIRRHTRPCVVPPLSAQSNTISLSADFAEIVSVPDSETRVQAMHALFERMGQDFAHEQWPVLLSYVRRFASVHPDCLDWIAVASEHPGILIGILLMGGVSLSEIVYEWEEYLPFKWWMLPINDWNSAIHFYLKLHHDQEEVIQILTEETQRTLRRIDERSDSFKICQEYLVIRALNGSPTTHEIAEVQNRGIDKSWELLERYARHTLLRERLESKWPDGINRDEWNEIIYPEHQFALKWLNTNSNYQQAVFDAPIVAAYFSIAGIFPKQSQRVFLSVFREFHPEWFDAAFRAAQAIFLNQFDIGARHE